MDFYTIYTSALQISKILAKFQPKYPKFSSLVIAIWYILDFTLLGWSVDLFYGYWKIKNDKNKEDINNWC